MSTQIDGPSLIVVPLELKEANALVQSWHRHHKKAQGHRFSIGALDRKTNRLVGAAIVGRPVARCTNHRLVLEVTRLVTDGTKNACSFLYAATARIGRELGYHKIQTFILDTETGTSLKAAGWEQEAAHAGGGQWKHTDGKPRRTDQPISVKQRWSRILCPEASDWREHDDSDLLEQLGFIQEPICLPSKNLSG